MLTLKSKKCNLGCGDKVLSGWVNVDKYNEKADIKSDVLDLPFENEVFEEVLLNHVIEHISYRKHTILLDEIYRILGPNGKLSIGYPEWEECAKRFLSNKNGEKWSWWIQTLYGTQSDPGQYHVSPICKDHLITMLSFAGFDNFEYSIDDYNAFIVCRKSESANWFAQEDSWTGHGL